MIKKLKNTMDVVFNGGGHVSVNGQSFSGRNITASGGSVIVDGEDVSIQDQTNIKVTIQGNCQSVKLGNGQVTVEGDAGTVSTTNGDVDCETVQGSVSTVNGDVDCGEVHGNVSTVNGDISH